MNELEKIRSIYIFKRIFDLVIYKIELKVLKYNKNLQKKLSLSIEDYKKLSGRYIIYVGKEYDSTDKKLIFEGEYIKGERNGVGKEFDKKGNMVFFGEFKNGKRDGKGKEFDTNSKKLTWNNDGLYYNIGNLKFEGEYKNGERS